MRLVVYDSSIFAQQQFGGVSRYFYEVAAGLKRSAEFEPYVVSPLYVNDYLTRAQFPVVGMKVAPTRHINVARARNLLNRALNPLVYSLLRPELVHETYYRVGPRARAVPTVTTVYDMIHEKFPSDFSPTDPTSQRKRASVERADLVACISEQTRLDLIELFGVPAEKTRVTHLASSMPVELADAAPEEAHKPYFICVGSRAGYKNFSTVLRAFAALGSLRGGMHILAFGGGAISPAERAQMAELRIGDDEVQHRSGDDHELARLYRGALALVYPSLYEGFGIPPLEAMTMGCPVICTAAGSLAEVVGNAALLVSGHSAEELTERMREVIESTETRARLIEGGRARGALFSWSRCASETMDIYRELLP